MARINIAFFSRSALSFGWRVNYVTASLGPLSSLVQSIDNLDRCERSEPAPNERKRQHLMTSLSLFSAKSLKFYLFTYSSSFTYFVSSFGLGMNLTQSRFWKFASIQLRGECCKMGKEKRKFTISNSYSARFEVIFVSVFFSFSIGTNVNNFKNVDILSWEKFFLYQFSFISLYICPSSFSVETFGRV